MTGRAAGGEARLGRRWRPTPGRHRRGGSGKDDEGSGAGCAALSGDLQIVCLTRMIARIPGGGVAGEHLISLAQQLPALLQG